MLNTLEQIMSLSDESITPHIQERAAALVIMRVQCDEGVPSEDAMAFYHAMTEGLSPAEASATYLDHRVAEAA